MAQQQPPQGLNPDIKLAHIVDQDSQTAPADEWPKAVAAARRLHDDMLHLEAENERVAHERDQSQDLLASVANLALSHQETIDNLEKHVGIDELTGLLDKRGLREAHETLLHGKHRRQTDPKAENQLLFLDLDKFSEVNEKLGHAGGDRTLQAVAGVLKKSFRESDIVGRFGGDEFMVMLPSTKREIAALKAEEVRAKIADMQAEIPITASIGISLIDTKEAFDAMYSEANQAMYKAKSQGRNQVVVFEETS